MYWLAWIGKAKVWPVNTNLVGTVTMKCLLGSACIYFVLVASGSAEKVDQRDFSIDTFRPTPNEVRLAEKRVHAYWTKHQAEYAANTRYLAVEAAAIFPAEVQDWSDFWG